MRRTLERPRGDRSSWTRGPPGPSPGLTSPRPPFGVVSRGEKDGCGPLSSSRLMDRSFEGTPETSVGPVS